MAAKFHIKRGDTEPRIRGIAKDRDGALINFAGAAVFFVYQQLDDNGAPVGAEIRRAATLVSYTATEAVLEYAWVAGDTATAGKYRAEFEVTLASGAVRTFPNKGFIALLIQEDVRT